MSDDQKNPDNSYSGRSKRDKENNGRKQQNDLKYKDARREKEDHLRAGL